MKFRSKIAAAFAAAALVFAAPMAAHADDTIVETETDALVEVTDVTEVTVDESVVDDESSAPTEDEFDENGYDPNPPAEEVVEETPVDSTPPAEDTSNEESDLPTDTEQPGDTNDDPGTQPGEENDVGEELPDGPVTGPWKLDLLREATACELPTRIVVDDAPWNRDSVLTYEIDNELVFTGDAPGGVGEFDVSYTVPTLRDGVSHYISAFITADDGMYAGEYGPTPACYAVANFVLDFTDFTNTVFVYVDGDVYVEDSNGNVYTETTNVVIDEETTFTPYASIEGQALDPILGGARTFTPYNDGSEDIVVVPTAPVQNGNVITIPEIEGVEYQLVRPVVILEPGDFTLTQDVDVLAIPLPGYTFPNDAVADWSYSYTAPGGGGDDGSDTIVVTPEAPVQDGNTVTIPEQEGVDYFDSEGNLLEPGDITLTDDLTVIAAPQDGYTILANVDVEWTFVYTAPGNGGGAGGDNDGDGGIQLPLPDGDGSGLPGDNGGDDNVARTDDNGGSTANGSTDRLAQTGAEGAGNMLLLSLALLAGGGLLVVRHRFARA